MTTTQAIPTGSLPGLSRLFLRYLEKDPQVLAYYQAAPAPDEAKRRAHETAAWERFPRPAMASILARQNRAFGCGDATLDAIEELRDPECVAVVTGQQLGLFTGPLYTIYKALTAIRLARELRRSGRRAIPVFWMDSDDHDLAEVTRVTVLRSDGSLGQPDYHEWLFGSAPPPAGSVGAVPLPGTITRCLTDYGTYLGQSSWAVSVRKQLESDYAPGRAFAEAFGRAMTNLLGGFGLVLLMPSDPEVKGLAVPVFERAIVHAGGIHEGLIERSRVLEHAGFHAQVRVADESSLLFLEVNGERRGLVRSGDTFALRGRESGWSPGELLRLARSEPWRLSPNVLLRPILQDHLLPTAVYVGGPAEIAYFAQAEVLYKHYGRPMPVIWPRAGFTLVDGDTAAAMTELNVTAADCVKPGGLSAGEYELAGQSENAAQVRELQDYVERELAALRPGIAALDHTLVPAVDTAGRKIRCNLDRLLRRTLRAEAESDPDRQARLERILNFCRPNGNLQERELGIFPFLSRHGTPLLDDLYSLIRLDSFTHLVVTIPAP
ncbi:MAG: bacillithiol biosynthesis cysteine-adding enzyme BshC [Acidobacteria bacterium]|nr:bacillithiol biosynthesis cysteine-adding enzyme BshC [Acidobacteriota bacterium]